MGHVTSQKKTTGGIPVYRTQASRLGLTCIIINELSLQCYVTVARAVASQRSGERGEINKECVDRVSTNHELGFSFKRRRMVTHGAKTLLWANKRFKLQTNWECTLRRSGRGGPGSSGPAGSWSSRPAGPWLARAPVGSGWSWPRSRWGTPGWGWFGPWVGAPKNCLSSGGSRRANGARGVGTGVPSDAPSNLGPQRLAFPAHLQWHKTMWR